MTTPLEAQELAKRLRAKEVKRWTLPFDFHGPEIEAHPNGAYVRYSDYAELAAAFLEHPVNTGQGDWQWISGALSAALEKQSSRDIAKETGLGHATVCRIANGHEPSVSSYFALARWLKPSLAARTPLASVEGAWCPDWTPSDQDKTAVALTLALSKHIPDWPGATDDQLADVAKAVLSALAQSGRSSAEPVAWQTHPDQTSPMTVERERFEDTVETVERPIRERQAETLGPEDGGVTAGETAPFPPVGPQEAVAVTDEMVRKASNEYLMHKGERPWRVLRGGQELWETCALAMRAALVAALSPSGIDLGGEVERLTKALAEADNQAEKLEALLEPYVSWDGKPSAFEEAKSRLATAEKALEHAANFARQVADLEDIRRHPEQAAMARDYQAMYRASLSTNAVREGDDG
jgi:hypothetical protein